MVGTKINLVALIEQGVRMTSIPLLAHGPRLWEAWLFDCWARASAAQSTAPKAIESGWNTKCLEPETGWLQPKWLRRGPGIGGRVGVFWPSNFAAPPEEPNPKSQHSMPAHHIPGNVPRINCKGPSSSNCSSAEMMMRTSSSHHHLIIISPSSYNNIIIQS